MAFVFLLSLLFFPLCANERDIQVLTEALRKDPDNGDTLFWLAESYQENLQYTNAISSFKLRLEKKGDPEQMWHSLYKLGQCYEIQDNWHQALYWYLEAHEANPGRLDPLLKIATYYRSRGENNLAHIFAKHGSRFLPSRDYHFDEELSIVSFYTRFKEDGYKAASDLLIRNNVPKNTKEQTYQNILFYIQNLKNGHFQPIAIDLPRIIDSAEERYHPMNPSIHKTRDGYKLICRAVNYTQKGAKEFETIDPDGYFRTRNFLAHYTQDFALLSQKEIIEDLPRDRLPSCNVLGLEDARIFAFQDASWFTCTTRDNTLEGIPQISLCKLDESAHVERMILLGGPDLYRCEKNWLPFVENGVFHVLYSYDPFVIYKPNMETGHCELTVNYHPTHDFSSFRGSAGPIEFDNGYLVLVHEVVYLSDHSRCYLHRFLHLDRHFFVTQISKPFTFLHQGVEFCTSMLLNHEGTKLILPVGIEDTKAYLCFLDLDTLRSLLTPLQTNI